MKYFSTSGDRTLVAGEGVQDETDLVRLKISMVVPCASDLALYEGKVPLAKPRIPGHMATAVVSEDREEYGLKLGARVMINPYILSTKDAEGYSKVGVYGLNADGFLRDFIALPIDNIVPFPEDVKEQEALFAEAVSVALAAFNSFRVEKGEYIAVVGGSVLGIIAAQLALYYQAIPILISNDRRYLEIASKCGVYYVIDEAAENTARRHKLQYGIMTALYPKPFDLCTVSIVIALPPEGIGIEAVLPLSSHHDTNNGISATLDFENDNTCSCKACIYAISSSLLPRA